MTAGEKHAGRTIAHALATPVVMAGLDPAIQETNLVSFFVYILASKRNGTLYIGVTSDLPRRIFEHKQGTGSKFTSKYGVNVLVHAEEFSTPQDAIQRETNLKRWPRKWKLDLIEKSNPEWIDLYETLV
jgi:putative endonuclease